MFDFPALTGAMDVRLHLWAAGAALEDKADARKAA
jgi:hypothetical protein